jgi:fatty-acyl-CoA synthase
MHCDILGERARLSPEREALLELASGRRLTYAEADARAVRMARVWREALGLARGDRVGLLARNRLEHVDAYFAAAKTGIILVPLSTRLTAAELAHPLAASGLRALLYDSALATTVAELRAAGAGVRWVALDEPERPGDPRLAELAAALPAACFARERCEPDDIHSLIYTSGTTGRPKGAMLPQRMIRANAWSTMASWGLGADDVTSIFTPFYHAAGMAVLLSPLFLAGGRVVIHREFDAREVVRVLAEEGCTVALCVPTILRALLEVPGFEAARLPRLRWLISGGAPLPAELAAEYRRRGLPLKQGYGLTEAGVNCFAQTVEEFRRKPGSIGRPLMWSETKLVDGEGREVALEEVGELCIRGPHVCAGYWRDPQATAEAIDADGWLHTGDLARRDGEGFHTVVGRRKDMYISGGVNIYPAEIEALLLEHSAVADCAVVGEPHAKWGEVGAAFVVPQPGAPAPGAEELVAHLAGRLARFKVPHRFLFVDELPRTAYGKVQKHLLAERLRG